jgi:CheY-like chemotaxis protein
LPPLNVLVAEDGLANRVLVQGLLRRDGHRVTFAENGLHAVSHLLRGAYDLVLMDIDMPILDGISATRTIRRQEVAWGRRTPVVALTSNDNREECLAAGMDGFLSKPLDLREFRSLIAALLKDRAA